MLEAILGTRDKERVLVYIWAREEGYAREIAGFYDANVDNISRNLNRLEQGGVLIGKRIGRTYLYRFNPRYVFLNELKTLLSRAVDFYPKELADRLIYNRRRPRLKGKPIEETS